MIIQFKLLKIPDTEHNLQLTETNWKCLILSGRKQFYLSVCKRKNNVFRYECVLQTCSDHGTIGRTYKNTE